MIIGLLVKTRIASFTDTITENEYCLFEIYICWINSVFLAENAQLIIGSKERTEEEWRELFNTVGLKLKKIYGKENFQAIIEAVKA